MKVKACIYTDAGKRRAVNQDSSLVKVATSKYFGRISFVAVCDGMGGLSKGEVASCKAIRALENWFHEELVMMQGIEGDALWDVIEKSWKSLIAGIDADIKRYGRHRGIRIGTTLTALLQIGRKYILMNIGDSRIYMVSRKEILQLTHDQSVVQDKIDKGIISKADAEKDISKNVLLQCIGAGSELKPEIIRGELTGSATVVACSDGLWKTVSQKDIFKSLCPQMCVTPEDMLDECKSLYDKAIVNGERDNITAAAMCLEF